MFKYDESVRFKNIEIKLAQQKFYGCLNYLCDTIYYNYIDSVPYDRAMMMGINCVTFSMCDTKYSDIITNVVLQDIKEKIFFVEVKGSVLNLSMPAIYDYFYSPGIDVYSYDCHGDVHYVVKDCCDIDYARINWEVWCGVARFRFNELKLPAAFTSLTDYPSIDLDSYKLLVDAGFNLDIFGDRTIVIFIEIFEFICSTENFTKYARNNSIIFITGRLVSSSMYYSFVSDLVDYGLSDIVIIAENDGYSFLDDAEYVAMYNRFKDHKVYIYLSYEDYKSKYDLI